MEIFDPMCQGSFSAKERRECVWNVEADLGMGGSAMSSWDVDSREEERDGVTFLRRQEEIGPREWGMVFHKIKDISFNPLSREWGGESEDANMQALWQEVEGGLTDVFYFSVGGKVI